MMRGLVIFVVFLAASISCSFTSKAQSQPDPWSAMALRDLQGIHDILRDNPGPVDPENQRYARWLEEGLALEQVARDLPS